MSQNEIRLRNIYLLQVIKEKNYYVNTDILKNDIFLI